MISALLVIALVVPAQPCMVPAYRLTKAQRAYARAYGRLAGHPRRTGRYDALIAQAARRRGLDPKLLKAVIAAESGFDPQARSPRGAVGLMQVMPATAAELGIHGPLTDPAVNIAAGAAYLAVLRKAALARFGPAAAADPLWLRRRIVAAYNGGPKALSGRGWRQETRLYVDKVLFYYETDLAEPSREVMVADAAAPE